MDFYVFLLVVVPLLFAFLFLIYNNKKYYQLLCILLCLVSASLAVLLLLQGTGTFFLPLSILHLVEPIILLCEFLILTFLYWVSIKHKRWHVLLLTILQTFLSIYSEFFVKKPETLTFNVDKLSIVMILIINIIGTLIVLFSDGYITHYEEHRKLKNKQRLYYAVICLFLSAMNGLVLTDSLSLVYLFWEITTLCSFMLISYNRDEEAYNSGFRALFLNLIGGICFSLGNILFATQMHAVTFTQVIENSSKNALYLLPVFLLCIAGFAKSAQVPFQSWLLGAMVAPTPISALLHSSTMVKAGVFLVIKLSPAYAGTYLGTSIAIFGAFSFLLCSAIAVSQRNAKRILAYSTIANLGLIIAGAGIGSSIAVSAAITILIFHAISKAMLFLCAGQIEHTINSRDIEDMTGLIHKAPFLTWVTILGICSMILPPFGMLITKWLSIEASVQNPVVAILFVFGSAFTAAFWIKWLSTLLAQPIDDKKPQNSMEFTVTVPLTILSIFVIASTIFIAPIFNTFISPQVTALLHTKNDLSISNGIIASNVGAFNLLIIFIVLLIGVVFYFLVKKVLPNHNIRNVYLCGENNSKKDRFLFRSGSGSYEKANVSNLYLYDFLNEKRITVFGYAVSISIILITFIGGLL